MSLASRFFLIVLCSGALATLGSVDGHAHRQPSESRVSPFMRVYGPTLPPFGFVSFCERHRSECAQGPLEEARFEMTPERLSELDHVNRSVNRLIEPTTDQDIYGVPEYWAIPVNRGDCEDYALLKRRELAAKGFSLADLLITVVRKPDGEGHAVLTVRTQQGDFVLDNLYNEVKPWYETSYTFLKRQASFNTGRWVSIENGRDVVVGALR
jgi:predicted transglutaminase-like cysteine proteinase